MNKSKQSAGECDKCGRKSKFIAVFIFLILLLSVSCKTEELPYKNTAEYLSGESKSQPVQKELKPETQVAAPKTIAKSDKVTGIDTDSAVIVSDTLIKETVLMTFVQYTY